MESPDWHMTMLDIHLERLLWIDSPVHIGVMGNDQADRLAGKLTTTSGLHLRRSEALGRLSHNLRAQSKGHHTIDRLEESGV